MQRTAGHAAILHGRWSGVRLTCPQAARTASTPTHRSAARALSAAASMSGSTQTGAEQHAARAEASHLPAPLGRQLLSVAPMMDWTDVHYRQLARIISKRTWLWTEMVVDKTVLHTPFLDSFLWFPPEQHPIVCQLGGSDPETLAAATRKVAEYGYDEINLNCGCPSDRVAGAGCFGASLMLQPELVAACMKAMGEAANGIPVTVKCRLGVDDVDSYEQLQRFVRIVSEGSPVRHFVVHARKCFLQGLNPHQNRTVPPLRHSWVYALRRDFPHLLFSLNGGVQTCHEAKSAVLYDGPWPTPGHVDPRDPSHQQQQQQQGRSSTDGSAAASTSAAAPEQPAATASCGCAAEELGSPPARTSNAHFTPDAAAAEQAAEVPAYRHIEGGIIEGVMIGRAAYNDPWGCLSDADRAVFGEPENAVRTRREVLELYMQYAETDVVAKYGVNPASWKVPNVRTLVKPLLGLFYAEPGSKRWKAALDIVLKQDPPSLRAALEATLQYIPDEVLDAPPRVSDVLPACSYGGLPTPEDRAGFNQTLTALKRAVRDAPQPQSKRPPTRTPATVLQQAEPATVCSA